MKSLKRLLSIIVSMTLLFILCPEKVHAETVDTQTFTAEYDSVEQYPDGGKNYTYYINGIENHYYVPPADFDPITASDEELSRYCFPARPDVIDEEAYLQWTDLMSNYSGTPEPEIYVELKPVEEPENDIVGRTSERPSRIWSGYESNLGNSRTTGYTQVQMDYDQPHISSTVGTCINSYWVGLGGRNTDKLMQAGTATEGSLSHYAWYEYLSDTGSTVSMQTIKSLSVNAGDNIRAHITYQPYANVFIYYIANNTTGKSASGSVTLDASTYYDGSTAEWIVERCTYSDSPTNLGNYGTISLTNCQANFDKSGSWTKLNSLSGLCKVIMTSDGTSSGPVLSQPSDISSDSSFTCTWENYN